MRADTTPASLLLHRRAVVAGGALTLTPFATIAAPADPPVLDARPLGDGSAYNGATPGPLLRVKLGEPVSLQLKNNLAAPTGLCFAGVRAAAAASPLVPPGGSAALRFTPPDAGTFPYHAAGPDAAAQTAGGLRGVLIVDETAPPPVDNDLLLALGDDGRTAAGVVVNGRPGPLATTAAPGARLRLRLVNGCVSRIAIVTVTGARPSVVAVDGQPSALFEPGAGTLPIGPGAGFDLMLDAPAVAGATVTATLRGDGRPDVPLLLVSTVGKAVAPRPPIAALPPNPRLPQRIALEKASRHTVTIAAAPRERWTVNGIEGPGPRPLFVVKRGAAVVLTLDNKSAVAQPLAVTGQCWRLLHDLDDGWDPYWRSTVLLAPGKSKHVAFVADTPGRWTLGGGDLVRRAAGLDAFFEVR